MDQYADLVKRLRADADEWGNEHIAPIAETAALEREAATAITTLEAENARLTEALQTARREALAECLQIANADSGISDCPYTTDKPGDPTWGHTDESICPRCGENAEGSTGKSGGVAKVRIAERIRSLLPAQQESRK